MPANTVTKNADALSRPTSTFACDSSAPRSASWARSIVLLHNALLTAMNMLADNPLPETSPIMKNTRSPSSRKKS